MEGEQSLPEDAAGKGKASSYAGIRLHPRRRGRGRGRHGKGKQHKFPAPMRLALWLALPIGLWAAIYAVVRLFE